MKMTRNEKLIEEVVLLLLKLKPDKREPDRTYQFAAQEAGDMADRAYRARTDPTWWNRVGSPHFNSRMAAIRRKLEA